MSKHFLGAAFSYVATASPLLPKRGRISALVSNGENL
jgi:hypothetical protein